MSSTAITTDASSAAIKNDPDGFRILLAVYRAVLELTEDHEVFTRREVTSRISNYKMPGAYDGVQLANALYVIEHYTGAIKEIEGQGIYRRIPAR